MIKSPLHFAFHVILKQMSAIVNSLSLQRHSPRSKGLLVLQEIRHLKAAKAARDQELGEAIKQLEAERFQVEELERNLLSQVSTFF